MSMIVAALVLLGQVPAQGPTTPRVSRFRELTDVVTLGSPICGHDVHVWDVAFSPDGTRLLSHDGNGGVRVWTAADSRHLADLPDVRGPLVWWSTDSKTISLLRWNGRRVDWSPGGASGTKPPAILRFGDSAHLATASAGGRFVWTLSRRRSDRSELTQIDTTTGQRVPVEVPIDLVVRKVVGRSTAAVVLTVQTGHDEFPPCRIRAHDAATRKPLFTKECEHFSDVAITCDGKHFIYIAPDWSFRICAIADGRELRRVLSERAPPASLAIDNTLSHAAIVTDLGSSTTLVVMDLATGGRDTVEAPTSTVSSVSFSPDGKRLAFADGERVRVHDIAAKQVVEPGGGHRDEVSDLAVSADGKRIVSAAADFVVWDLETGAIAGRIKPTPRTRTNRIVGVDLAGSEVVWGYSNGTLCLRTLAGKERTIKVGGDGGDLAGFLLSADRHSIATLHYDRLVIRRLSDLSVVREIEEDGLRGAVLNGEKITTLNEDGLIRRHVPSQAATLVGRLGTSLPILEFASLNGKFVTYDGGQLRVWVSNPSAEGFKAVVPMEAAGFFGSYRDHFFATSGHVLRVFATGTPTIPLRVIHDFPSEITAFTVSASGLCVFGFKDGTVRAVPAESLLK